MATDAGYDKGNYLRVCDICGHRYHFRDLVPIGELRFACPDDAPGLTSVQISRFNARARPLVIRPNKWAKDYTQTGIYQLAEAQVFNYVSKVAPSLVADDVSNPMAAAWAAIYVADIIIQAKRPLTWIRTATTTLQRCLTYLLTLQYGSPTGTAGTSDNPRYGGILSAGVSYSTPITIAAGVAFLKGYQALGTQGYLSAADRCAVYLRHVQCGDLQVASYTTFPANSTARYHIGGLAESVPNSTGILDRGYNIADVLGLWFLSILGQIRGTATIYGDSAATAFFVSATAASIATMTTELTVFAETGAMDSSIGAVRSGLSTTTPFLQYFAGVNGTTGGAIWTGSPITSDDFASALLGLYLANGNDATVTTMMAWLAAFTSNPIFETAAGTPEPDVLAGTGGTYDPAIAPATVLTGFAPFMNNTSAYDWGAEGLLAPILSATSQAAFRTSKDAVSTSRRFSYYDVANLFIGPIGYSGLSLQPRSDGTGLGGQNVVTAAKTGMIYRYDPGRYPAARGS